MMHITLNNKEEKFDCNSMTVSRLLEEKKFTFPYFIVKVNGKMVKKEEYESAIIREGDDVKVLHMMAGG